MNAGVFEVKLQLNKLIRGLNGFYWIKLNDGL
jgi:hypothetical protein